MADKITTGNCLCGVVSYRVTGEMRDIMACHCSQCRKQTGHHYAATNARNDALTISGEENLTWYAASDMAQRGFCSTCGSALFWKPNDGAYTSILAGSLDDGHGLKLTKHIFCADKGEYYEIDPNIPQFPQSS
ncbi:MAG: GFA family protein [Pseudomonadota bacterium]